MSAIDVAPVRPPRPQPATVLAIALAVVTVCLALFASYWRLSGGRWFIVDTPSMGTSAPVGTMLWVEPLGDEPLRVGEFVTVRAPGHDDTYSHRVHAVYPDGTFTTKGDVTAPDPWRLSRSDVVGRVAMRWWAVGWLIRGAPVLCCGLLLLWLLVTRVVATHWRVPASVSGASVVICICLVVYRPLTRAVRLGLAPGTQGGHATYINAGLLPLRLTSPGTAPVDLRAGEHGTIWAGRPDAHGVYWVHVEPHVPWWCWAALVIACFLPACWTVRRRTSDAAAPADAVGDDAAQPAALPDA